MALFDKLFSLKRRLDSDNYESKDRGRPCQINPEQVRLLLFKECDWRGRKLLFDSSAIEKVPAGKNDKPNTNLVDTVPFIVEVSDGYSYVYKGPEADANLLGEMVFGAVAMNYKSVSLKIHIMDEPRRLMCSKVFCVPTSRRISCAERKISDKTSSNCVANSSTPLNVPSFSDDGVALSFSMDRGDSGFCDHSSYSSVGSTFDHISMFDHWDGNASQEDFYSFHSLPGRKLSTSSNGSWQRRTFQNIATRFDLGQNSHLLNVPTSHNSDSQIQKDRVVANMCDEISEDSCLSLCACINTKEMSLCRGELGSEEIAFLLLASDNSAEKSNSTANGTSDSIASGSLVPQRKNKLGLAVLITVTDSHQLDAVRAWLEHSPALQALVCRLRAAALVAPARARFLAALHQAAYDAATWLSDLIYGPRLQPLWLNMVTSDAKISNKLADGLLSDLCSVLAVADTKTTNFFISTLLTHVLTYHLGWVTTVSPYDTIDHQKISSTNEVKKPYNALWAQLSDLCGSIGFPPRASRTIISGEKNTPFVKRLLSVLTYFLRCGDVKRTVFEYQECVFKETKTVNMNRSETSGLKRTATRMNKLVDCDKLTLAVDTQNSDSVSTLVPSDVSLNKTATLADLTRKLSTGAECGSSSTGQQPTLGTLRRNPTKMVTLKASSESSLNSSVSEDSESYQKVVFVLGDDEKLVGLKNKSTNGKCVKKSSKVQNEPVDLETEPKQLTCKTEGCKDRDTESPSKCCGQTLQHSKPIKHSGFKFEFDKYPQIVTNYMKSKNLEILDRHYIGKPGNLKLNNFQFDPMVVPPIQEEKCDTCVKCQMMEVMLQTPTNASEMEYMNDLPRQSEPQYAKETVVVDTERQHREISPKTFVRTRKKNVVVVNLIKNIESAAEGKGAVDEANAESERLGSLETESKSIKVCNELEVCNLNEKLPEISIQHVVLPENEQDEKPIIANRPLLRTNKLKFTKSVNNLNSLLSLEDSYTEDSVNKDKSLDQNQLELGNAINELRMPSENFSAEESTKVLSNELDSTTMNNSNVSHSPNGLAGFKSNDLKFTQRNEQTSTEFKSSFSNGTSDLLSEVKLESNKPSIPLELKRQERERDRTMRGKAEKERDRFIDVKTVTEFVTPELSAKTDTCPQRSGFDRSLLGGVTDHYVPDLILQGTTAKPISFESELRRDLDITSYLNKQLEAPVNALAIVGDTNTWEVRVVGRECGAGGMSSLVAATLDALPAMRRARVPAHQCISFLESKLREFCVLSKTLADMLMSTDFCDIATLTKSLNIDVNDVPLLLAVATTHTPQVATRYGISYR